MFGADSGGPGGRGAGEDGTDYGVWEFGAGSGALAVQLLHALDEIGRVRRALPHRRSLGHACASGSSRRWCAYAERVEWLDELPESMQGVVVGNEVLDAMPVQLLARVGGQWFERGVVRNAQGDGWSLGRSRDRPAPAGRRAWRARLPDRNPSAGAKAFIATLADRLKKGAAFFIDYGFPEGEYYHPQRHMGTLMCHRAHQADGDPLSDVGYKDITAHVDFTGIAVAGQEAGLEPCWGTRARRASC
jgi:SAM-dependent MidA family methyltransferase